MFRRKTAPIEGANAVSELTTVKIGGMKQWVSIRGTNQQNPLLLFLHGGPGTGQIGFIGTYQRELEKHFVVVNWDQRGAGLSYYGKIPKETMNINQFVQDTIELTQYMLHRFNKENLYLIGHSWGTIIGLLAVHERPDLYKRYFGVSQVADVSEAERVSYEILLERAKNENNPKAYQALTRIGKPPWQHLKYDRIHQKYLEEFRGGISHDGTFIKTVLLDSEYHLELLLDIPQQCMRQQSE
jgi:pimeloyl-ACP methyl ester carboxylesterase